MKKNEFKIAIVGRPNVGKSRLFNRLIGKRTAVIDEFAGVTRDFIVEDLNVKNKKVKLIDTAGINFGKQENEISEAVQKKAFEVLKKADLILFVCDITDGIVSLDRQIADTLRKKSKKIILIANKSDNSKKEQGILEFYELNMGDPLAVSAIHGMGINKLIDKIYSYVKNINDNFENIEQLVKISFVGRPNAGKSSFFNAVLKEERVIVDNIPGTTRDSINTEFKYKNINYLLSDTAGIRHKSKISSKVDAYSSRRTKDSIKASSVCLVIMDGWQGLFKDDIRIIEMVLNEGKGCVLAVNKWDMVNNMNFLQYKEMLFSRMKKISNIPVIFTSAKNGYNVLKAFDLLKEVGDNRDRWIATSKLNNLINKAFKKHFPPVRNGKRLKIYYCTQVASSPPCIKFFINDKKFIDNSYMMYLEGRLREEFFLKGVPLNFVYESSHKGKDN